MGAASTRLSLRPLFFRRRKFRITLAQNMRRDREVVSRALPSAVIIRESG
jgi:hypothetical protein